MAAECAFAEAYFLRRLHMEKMKAREEEEEEEERTKSAGIEAQPRRGKHGNRGGFFGKFKIKKVRPSSAVSSDDV